MSESNTRAGNQEFKRLNVHMSQMSHMCHMGHMSHPRFMLKNLLIVTFHMYHVKCSYSWILDTYDILVVEISNAPSLGLL